MEQRDLAKELKARGTAEIINGKVVQVTQALDETKDSVTFLEFGEMKTKEIIPIEEACAKCFPHRHTRFKTAKECQDFQAKDGRVRGFHTLICPQQFVEGK